jgi:hypothetical protein
MQTLTLGDLQLTLTDPHHFEVANGRGIPIFTYTFLPEHYASLHQWLGFVDTEQMLVVIKYVLAHTREHQLPTTRCISDFTTFEGGFSEAVEWFVNEFLPIVIPMGFKGEAVIFPKDFFAELTIEGFKESAQRLACEHVYLRTLAEGMAWLEAHRARRLAKSGLPT